MLSDDLLMRLKDITKVDEKEGRRRKALTRVNLDITSGDFISIFDPDAEDRDTMFGIMGLIEPPTSGTVFLKRKKVSSLPENKRTEVRLKHLGLVFKANIFVDELTVRENIELFLKEAGVPKKAIEKRVFAALEMVGLEDKADFKPPELSKFDIKAASIARAIANRPDIIIVNEPPDEANAKGKTTVDLLREINGKMDITIVITTTNEKLGKEADRVVVIEDDGQVKES